MKEYTDAEVDTILDEIDKNAPVQPAPTATAPATPAPTATPTQRPQVRTLPGDLKEYKNIGAATPITTPDAPALKDGESLHPGNLPGKTPVVVGADGNHRQHFGAFVRVTDANGNEMRWEDADGNEKPRPASMAMAERGVYDSNLTEQQAKLRAAILQGRATAKAMNIKRNRALSDVFFTANGMLNNGEGVTEENGIKSVTLAGEDLKMANDIMAALGRKDLVTGVVVQQRTGKEGDMEPEYYFQVQTPGGGKSLKRVSMGEVMKQYADTHGDSNMTPEERNINAFNAFGGKYNPNGWNIPVSDREKWQEQNRQAEAERGTKKELAGIEAAIASEKTKITKEIAELDAAVKREGNADNKELAQQKMVLEEKLHALDDATKRLGITTGAEIDRYKTDKNAETAMATAELDAAVKREINDTNARLADDERKTNAELKREELRLKEAMQTQMAELEKQKLIDAKDSAAVQRQVAMTKMMFDYLEKHGVPPSEAEFLQMMPKETAKWLTAGHVKLDENGKPVMDKDSTPVMEAPSPEEVRERFLRLYNTVTNSTALDPSMATLYNALGLPPPRQMIGNGSHAPIHVQPGPRREKEDAASAEAYFAQPSAEQLATQSPAQAPVAEFDANTQYKVGDKFARNGRIYELGADGRARPVAQ